MLSVDSLYSLSTTSSSSESNVLKHVLLLMLALTSSVGAQVSPQNNTPFWRTTCSRTDAAKELFDALADATKKAEACRVEHSQSRTQNIDLTEELKKARLDLESAREETKVARAEAIAARERGEELLRRALSQNRMGVAYFKHTNIGACPAAVQKHFRDSSSFSVTRNNSSGARAQSSTCGASAWCSGITDKDGASILIVHVACTDGRENELLDEIRKVAAELR